MKRLISIFACIIMACCVCSCNQSGANTGTNSSTSQSSQERISEKVVLETKQYTMFFGETDVVQKISDEWRCLRRIEQEFRIEREGIK